MSVNDETVSFSLEVNIEPALTNLRKIQTVMYRSLSIAQRLGLRNLAIKELQQQIAAVNALRLALISLQAAAGPIGWALAITAAIGAGVTIGQAGAGLYYDVGGR